MLVQNLEKQVLLRGGGDQEGQLAGEGEDGSRQEDQMEIAVGDGGRRRWQGAGVLDWAARSQIGQQGPDGGGIKMVGWEYWGWILDRG